MPDLDREDDELRLDDGAQALIDGMSNDDEVIVDRSIAGKSAERGGSFSEIDLDAVNGGQPRDDAGRFAPRESDAQPDAAAKPGTPSPVTLAGMKEFIDATQARQTAERERDELRARLAKHEQPARPNPLEDDTLLYTDPKAFREAVLAEARQGVANVRLELQEGEAMRVHGDGFKEADTALKAHPQFEQLGKAFLRQPNPYEAMMQWHRREKTLSAIPDGDLPKYEASLQERLLKDPAFLARAAEAARGQGAGQPGADRRPSNVTRLPSVGRAGTAALAAIPDDLSDVDLLASMTRR